MKINTISNDKYFITLEIYIDQTRRDAYFIIELGEYNISGSYKKKIYTTGKAAFREYDRLTELLYSIHGIK